MAPTIAWLSVRDVLAACPPGVSLDRVRRLLRISGLAHRSGNRLYLRSDRLEQFIEESFADRLPGVPRRRPATRPTRLPKNKNEPLETVAARLATGLWRTAGTKK
jgi:hypothetical protein